MKLLKCFFENCQQAKLFFRLSLQLLILSVAGGCVQSPVLGNPNQLSSDTHQTDGNDKFQEIGNNTTATDNEQLKPKITTTLETRGEIAYLPNDPLPFTGVFQKFYANGKKEEETNYIDGKKNGLATFWYENGQKQREVNYKDGKVNGLATFWDESGQKQEEANYKDGKKNGLKTHWHENGQKKSETNYKDGKENGLTTLWHKNGQKHAEVNYNDGKENGLTTIWYENGQKFEERNYKDGKENGLTTTWDENGQKFEERNYKDGEEVAPEKSSIEDNLRTQQRYVEYSKCSTIASLAESIMRARQTGVSITQVMEADLLTNDLTANMIITAYETDRYASVELQQKIIELFRDKAYLQCFKSIKP